MSPSESLQRPEGCPDLEDIAAFIDKTLEPGERQRLIRHFVQCRDCYEIFAGASRYYLDAQADDGNVIPFSRKKLSVTTGLAAAAVLAVAIGVRSYRTSLELPISGAAQLVSPTVARAATDVWEGPTDRGANGHDDEGLRDWEKREFSLGVQVVNLQAGLTAGNSEQADEAVRRIYNLLKEETLAADIQRSYSDLQDMILDREKARTSLQDVLPVATQAGTALQDRLDSPHFELGRWTEAGFLAALAHDPQFFESREARRFPGWLLRYQEKEEGKPKDEQDLVAPEALDEVRTLQQLLEERAPLEDKDYEELEGRLKNLLSFYYPYSREEEFSTGPTP